MLENAVILSDLFHQFKYGHPLIKQFICQNNFKYHFPELRDFMRETGGNIDNLERSIRFYLKDVNTTDFSNIQKSTLDFIFDIVSSGNYDFFDFPSLYGDFANSNLCDQSVSTVEIPVSTDIHQITETDEFEMREVA